MGHDQIEQFKPVVSRYYSVVTLIIKLKKVNIRMARSRLRNTDSRILIVWLVILRSEVLESTGICQPVDPDSAIGIHSLC